jgi:hypothetical protein
MSSMSKTVVGRAGDKRSNENDAAFAGSPFPKTT